MATKPITYNKANDLRVDLNAVLRENVSLVMAATRRTYDGDPYAQDAIQALDANTNDIATIIGDFYGPDAKGEYTQLWKNQDTYFINYTKAIKENNHTLLTKSKADLDNYDEASVKFWQSHGSKLDLNNYQQVVIDRVNFIKSAIDAYAARNIAKSYKQQHGAYQQIGKVADLLAEAIIQQFPDKFTH